ncbi:MAG: ribosome maturation factor RimM [Desulfobacca sp.]|uniref:ribosome maturation factor RimM n=1 Tax=Desulfobacca sp. TaxID=2067990 RepID=UPI00404958B4
MSDRTPRRVCLGRLTRPHGLRGEIRARLEVDDPETLAAVDQVEIDGVPYQLLAVRAQKNAFLLSLAGITTREAAQNLAGREIWIDSHQLPPLPAGEYYQFDIIGLPVYLAETAAAIGTVVGILTTPGHDVFVIQGQGVEYLVPAIAEVIVSIEPEHRRMVITAAGLATAHGAY